MKLWVDDMRDPYDWCAEPETWTWVETYDMAIDYLQMGDVTYISLDHDLADFTGWRERTGYDIAIWMAENNVWPKDGASSHSANPIGRERIEQVIDRYGPY